jgi:hypothetical protein
MKFTTLRNLMASMLVVGVAGSVIAVGNGTFALFNATTTNPNNVFSTNDLIFKNTPSGGSVCTAQATVNSGATPTCSTLVTLSNMVPGDSKLGSLTLQNASTVTSPNDGVSLSTSSVTASSTSLLDSTSFANSATTGLGLLVFMCETSGSADRPCTGNGTGTTTLVPVYGSCTANPVTGGVDVATTDISGASSTADTLTIGGATCTGANVLTSSMNVTGFDTVNSGSGAIANGNSVHVAVVVYLPGIAGDTVAGKSSTLSFNWTANTVIGRSQ